MSGFGFGGRGMLLLEKGRKKVGCGMGDGGKLAGSKKEENLLFGCGLDWIGVSDAGFGWDMLWLERFWVMGMGVFSVLLVGAFSRREREVFSCARSVFCRV